MEAPFGRVMTKKLTHLDRTCSVQAVTALPLAYKVDPGAGELKVVGVDPDRAEALAE